MARPSKLTADVEERIVAAVRAGTSIAGAARYAGIDSSTFHRWMERGDPSGTERADRRFRALRARVEEARAAAEVRDITLVAKAAEHDWRAAAWRLAQRMPERYGRAATAEVLPEAPQDDILTSLAYMTREERHHLRGIYDTAKERRKKGERPSR